MYGRTVLNQASVLPTRVSADGAPIFKAGGVTIDWSVVNAIGSDTTLPDGSLLRAGEKFLQYGQVLTKITLAGTDAVTITGSPTGGTFTISVTTSGGLNPGTQTTTPLAYNASTAAVQAALQALTNTNSTVGNGLVTVTGTAGSSYSLLFDPSLGTATVTASGALLTGGTSPAATVSTTSDNNVGWFGPYDPNATDGRATLTRGSCYVMDMTLPQYGSGTSMVSAPNDQTGGVIEGGLIYLGRVLQSGTNAASLAAGPTLANFIAAFPLFSFVQN